MKHSPSVDDRIEFLTDQADRDWPDYSFGSPDGTVRTRSEIRSSSIDNPFWEVVSRLPTAQSYYPSQPPRPDLLPFLERLDLTRHHLVKEFAFAIPSPGDIDWVKSVVGSRRIVEVMAGTGYWAYVLRQAGVDILATDISPVVSNDYQFTKQWDEVKIADSASVAASADPDDILMMIWPPYQQDSAKRALNAFTGDSLILGGEMFGGACADPAFWESLEDQWVRSSWSSDHITWETIHCELQLWNRKDQS